MKNQIGQTIWQQMNVIDRNLVWCMGVEKPTSIENGLRFKVNGRSFKGLIEITLNGKDLYDVKLIKVARKQNQNAKALGVVKFDLVNETKEVVNDLFVDQLMPLLEEKVESRSS